MSKTVRDFVYHSTIFRGLDKTDALALAKHLEKYLRVKS